MLNESHEGGVKVVFGPGACDGDFAFDGSCGVLHLSNLEFGIGVARIE
jgi:hypothetical protein